MEREKCKKCGRFLSKCPDPDFATSLNPKGLFCWKCNGGVHFCLYAHYYPSKLRSVKIENFSR